MKRNKRDKRYYERKREVLLNRLRKVKPFIGGSMVKISHTCGNANCKCARGEKHENYYLTYKEKKKTVTKYIPVGMEEEVRGWVKENKRIKEITNQITELGKKIIKQYGIDKKVGRGRK